MPSSQSATQRPTATAGNPPPANQGANGLPVDKSGGPTIDPTKNVLDLVAASITRQDDLRAAEMKRQDDVRWSENRRMEELSLAETRRLDDLSRLRQYYDQRIADNQSVQVKTTSDLISTQLDKSNTALATQIRESNMAVAAQITSINTNLSAKIADLERFRWEYGGKTSVADPAMNALADAVAQLQGTRKEGISSTWGLLFSVVLASSAAAGLISFLLSRP